MLRRPEVLRGTHAREPAVEPALGQLDHAMALRAHQVMVMALAAEAVAGLAAAVRELVDDPLAGERAQRAVHRRQSDAIAARDQAAVDLLGGRVVRLGRQHLEDSHPLAGRPEAGALERGCRLTGVHVGT